MTSRARCCLNMRCFSYETIEAATGAEAVEKASIENPDLIVMEICLPDITGVQAAKTVKENPSTSRVPIIAHLLGARVHGCRKRRTWRCDLPRKTCVDKTDEGNDREVYSAVMQELYGN
jgi:chemotaxis response regulator CheB